MDDVQQKSQDESPFSNINNSDGYSRLREVTIQGFRGRRIGGIQRCSLYSGCNPYSFCPRMDAYGWFFPEELTTYPIMPNVVNREAALFADYSNVPNKTGLGGDSEGNDFYFFYGNALFLVLNSQSNDVEEHKEAIELAIAANLDAAIESYYYISRSTAVRIMRWMRRMFWLFATAWCPHSMNWISMQIEEPTYMNVEVIDDSVAFTTYKVSD